MIKRFILKIVANTGAIYATDYFLETMSVEGGAKAFIVLAIIFTIVNIFLKPILKIISFPLMMLTGGLFVLVINAFLLYISNLYLPVISPDLKVDISSIGTYFAASIVIGIISWFEWLILKPRKHKKRDDDEDEE